MKERLAALCERALSLIASAGSEPELDAIETGVLGRKGELATLMRGIGGLPAPERAPFGVRVNEAKERLEQALAARRKALEAIRLEAELSDGHFDPTEPALPSRRGHLHPITQVRREIEAIFIGLGFDVVDGPEVETEEFNFDRLNIPAHHPARDMQDTFWLENGQVLRTHTSPVQLRAMLAAEGRTPLRVIAPGRVFRNEQPDATHEHTFHQVEGLVVDETTHLGHLKWVLAEFCRAFFENDNVKMRFRASHFPFTEPSMEVDINCSWEGGQVKIGQGSSWLEILGSGMVHPNVIRHGGLDPDKYQGYAFGMGLDRIAMLKYGIPDLRAFFEADLRWLRHYGFRALQVPTLAGGLS